MLRLFFVIVILSIHSVAFALDISTVPVEQSSHNAPSIVTFVVDDSGSMDFEFMTKETEGMFSGLYYLFAYNRYLKNGYQYSHGDNSYSYSSYYLTAYSQEYWKARFYKYNTIFYNPTTKYNPWPGCSNADIEFPEAHANKYLGEDVFTSSSNKWRNNIVFDLHDVVLSLSSSIKLTSARYYTFNDKNSNNILDSTDTLYLVNFTGGKSNLKRSIYKVKTFNPSDKLDIISSSDLQLVTAVEAGTPIVADAQEDIQNFANWFTYYRKRGLAATATVANSIDKAEGTLIALYSINESVIQGAVPVKVDNTNYSISLIQNLYRMNWYGGTPLRNALKKTGEYLKGNSNPIGSSPYYSEAEGGSCQQAFTVLITDGFWNDSSVSNIGNQDGSEGKPYADKYSDTLADVAMKYYKEDLRSDLSNSVPTSNCDDNTKQHMVTFTLSFGIKGTLDYMNYPRCLENADPSTYPVWLNPHTYAMGPQKIDDLWHAAVNGRGAFFSADDPSELEKAMESVMGTIETLSASSSKVAVSTTYLSSSSVVFKSQYKTSTWTGDLLAYSLDKSTESNALSIGDQLWSAAIANKNLNPSDRVIVTWSDTPTEFSWSSLNEKHKTILASDEVVRVLRGESINGYRKKDGLYGDMVHSSPVSYDGVVYVGANDGMLHAFDAETGVELFNIIPSFLIPKLTNLVSIDFQHQFYVDGQIHVKKIAKDKTILVCGLGSGGKGYFAIDISNIKTALKNAFSKANKVDEIKNRFLWEFPKSNDPNMGLSYSGASIVKTNDGSYSVIFGNGYNSINGESGLYVVDALTGSLKKTIMTGAASTLDPNGLSTPSVIDIPHGQTKTADSMADFVYAGDLHGNLWKFDLTSEYPVNWKVAYNNLKPVPLFKAVGQKITTKPDITWHLNSFKQRDAGVMVVFGTGTFFHINDIMNQSPNTLYGIWDYHTDGEFSYVGEFSAVDNKLISPMPYAKILLQHEDEYLKIPDPADSKKIIAEYRFTSKNIAKYELIPDSDGVLIPHPPKDEMGQPTDVVHLGWAMNLPGYGKPDKDGEDGKDFKGDPVKTVNGERLINSPIIKNGRAIFVTSVPTMVACGTGGKSMLMELDPNTGAALNDEFLDIDGDGDIDGDDLVSGKVPSGIKIDGFAYQPVIIDKLDETESKLVNTSSSKVEIIDESTESEGVRSWREVRN